MFRNPAYRTVFGIWLAWIVILMAYQVFVPARIQLAPPDRAQEWTVTETMPGSQDDKIYLNEPFLNEHVSWDSEFYLAIAAGGYDNPAVRTLESRFGLGVLAWSGTAPTVRGTPGGLSLNYAFFPFYPLMIALFSLPLRVLGLTPIATVTLAGVVVSALGALAAMLALYELARDELGHDGGLRAAFYLVIFPSGFFLAQVYTEGLFVGLAFTSLAFLRYRRRGWAAFFAVLATFTRAAGVSLAIPLLLDWLKDHEWTQLDMEWRQIYYRGLPWRAIGNAVVALAPLLAFGLWRVSYFGMAFSVVEDNFFGRGLLSLGSSFISWSDGFRTMFGNNPQAAAYYMIEWGGVLLGFTACIVGLRYERDVALFGLIVIFLSFTSGPAQGMHRYILAAPSVFLFLSRLGRNPVFDRAWTILSILLMGLLATLFTFNMWTG